MDLQLKPPANLKGGGGGAYVIASLRLNRNPARRAQKQIYIKLSVVWAHVPCPQLDKHAIIVNVHFLFVIVEVGKVVSYRHVRSPQRNLEIEKQ